MIQASYNVIQSWMQHLMKKAYGQEHVFEKLTNSNSSNLERRQILRKVHFPKEVGSTRVQALTLLRKWSCLIHCIIPPFLKRICHQIWVMILLTA